MLPEKVGYVLAVSRGMRGQFGLSTESELYSATGVLNVAFGQTLGHCRDLLQHDCSSSSVNAQAAFLVRVSA